MTNDHQLRQDVLDELDFEPSVNATHIGVGANAGVITLTGFVSSYGEKLAAERAARRVRGVKAIAEEIEVRLPSDKKSSDDEIAGRAVDILKWRVGLPANRISVKVEKGIVTLTGDVDWRFQKTEAEAAVHNLTGVAGVANLIRVNLAGSASRSQGEDPEGAAPERRSWTRRGSPSKPTAARSFSAARSMPGTSATSPSAPPGRHPASPRFRTTSRSNRDLRAGLRWIKVLPFTSA